MYYLFDGWLVLRCCCSYSMVQWLTLLLLLHTTHSYIGTHLKIHCIHAILFSPLLISKSFGSVLFLYVTVGCRYFERGPFSISTEFEFHAWCWPVQTQGSIPKRNMQIYFLENFISVDFWQKLWEQNKIPIKSFLKNRAFGIDFKLLVSTLIYTVNIISIRKKRM